LFFNWTTIITSHYFRLEDCNLDRALFKKCNLSKTDFRNAYNFIIDPTINQMKGAKFSSEGALSLLNGFGIKVG